MPQIVRENTALQRLRCATRCVMPENITSWDLTTGESRPLQRTQGMAHPANSFSRSACVGADAFVRPREGEAERCGTRRVTDFCSSGVTTTEGAPCLAEFARTWEPQVCMPSSSDSKIEARAKVSFEIQ